jgi:sterol 3beta-glucosyltransferase
MAWSWSPLQGNLGRQNLSETIFQLDFVPYGWLFPRMTGVAIHGGSGTTAAALRAGVPTLIVPFLMDQFYWGRRVFELGAGPRPIPFKRLTAERLAEAIICMVNDSAMAAKAAALGENIRAEDGVGQAIKIIDQYG